MMKSIRYNKRKGFTLIELVLAMAITSILVSCVGTLITSAVRVRQLAQTREELLQASLRVHNALVGELSTASDVTVYTNSSIDFSTWSDGEYLVYVGADATGNRYLYQGAKLMLPNNDSFDYYNGARFADELDENNAVVNPAISIRIVGVPDYKYVGDSNPQTCYRCLQITTTLTKNNRYYTHTSTVRLNELSLYAKGDYSGEVMVWSSASSSSYAATMSDVSTSFVAVRYRNKRST